MAIELTVTSRRSRRNDLQAFAIYLALSVLIAGLPVLGDPATVHVGFLSDPSQMMWFLVWWPYALVHGLNPFISHVIWAPTGANLTWTTSIPAVALVMQPVTWTFGPVVSYNVAALVAPALSAWSAFALCKWLTGNFAAALVGGLLYGFSPYELGHLIGGHLCFTFNFVPPLCLLLFSRLLEQGMTRCSFVISFASLLVTQCLISNEVFATMTAFGGLAWVGGFALFPVARRRALVATLWPLGAAYLAAASILAPFFYFALANGAVPGQPLFPPSSFSADLLDFVAPRPLFLLAPHSVEAITSRAFGNLQENEFYLGVPMLVLVVRFLWVRRSEPLVRILAVMFALIVVAAIGPVLHVADHSLAQLPWAAAFDLPLLGQALPVRFANYGFLVIALIVSLSWAAPDLRFTKVLVVYGLAAYLPNLSLFLWPERYPDPPFFSTGLYRKVLHRGENIVILPFGVTGPSMMWQAETGMYFSMSGAWMGPTPQEFQRWPAVNAALAGLPLPDPGRQLRCFLLAHRVEAVVAAAGAGPLPAALGIKPIELGGVSVYQLPRSMATGVSDQTIEQLEEAATQQWFADLLDAAGRFLAADHSLANLNPVRLHEMGLLPKARWGRRLDLVLGGASHGAFAGLWIGPGANRTVAVGLFVSPAAAAGLAARYRDQATSILYPYPLPFTGTVPRDHRIEFLLMTVPLAFVHKAGSLSPSTESSVNQRNWEHDNSKLRNHGHRCFTSVD
jgi:hypothetical protein